MSQMNLTLLTRQFVNFSSKSFNSLFYMKSVFSVLRFKKETSADLSLLRRWNATKKQRMNLFPHVVFCVILVNWAFSVEAVLQGLCLFEKGSLFRFLFIDLYLFWPISGLGFTELSLCFVCQNQPFLWKKSVRFPSVPFGCLISCWTIPERWMPNIFIWKL